MGHGAHARHEAREDHHREHHHDDHDDRLLDVVRNGRDAQTLAHHAEAESKDHEAEQQERALERKLEPEEADREDQEGLSAGDEGRHDSLADQDLDAVGGRHEHHVERAVLALARDRETGKQQHLNEREHGNEARHDRVAGDPVLVPTRAVAHLDGEPAAVLRVDLRRDRADVAVGDARGRGVAGVGDDHHLALAVEVVREVDPDERLTRVDALLEVGERDGVSLEVEDAVARDAAHDFGRGRRVRLVKKHPGHALKVEGRAVAKENGLQEHRRDEHHARALVAERDGELLHDDGEDAVERRAHVPPEGLQHDAPPFGSDLSGTVTGGRLRRTRTAMQKKSAAQQQRIPTLRHRIGPSPARKHCLKASTA